MTRMLCATAAVACAIGAGTIETCAAAEPPADKVRVARLVRELSADAHAVRTQAAAELEKLGPTARAEIQRAATSDDPEVRLRAKDLLLALNEHDLWTPREIPKADDGFAHSGPVRARIVGARYAQIDDDDDEESQLAHNRELQIAIEVAWEDQFKLAAYRAAPALIMAMADNSSVLAAADDAADAWHVVSRGAQQLTLVLRCEAPATQATALDRLRVRWGAIAVGDFTSLEVNDLKQRGAFFQDDIELSIVDFHPIQHGRYEIAVSVRRYRNLSEPPELLFAEHDLELLDGAGKKLRRHSMSQTLADHGATIRASFAAAEGSVPQKLRFTYPRLRSHRDLEFEFRGVSLPAE